jgi:GNAT superfamily N-acetyltransferase
MRRTQPGLERLEIRQASYADRGAIADFFGGLSPSSRYLRFFTSAPSLSAKMLRILSGGGDNIDVVVATEQGTVIGHAMAVDAVGPTGVRSADIGVVVADDRQGGGVGSQLMLAVAARARARGVTTLVMDVLAENRRVLAMIARRWPEARHEISRASVTVRAHLGASDPADRAQPGLPCAGPGKIPVGHGSGRGLLSTSDR